MKCASLPHSHCRLLHLHSPDESLESTGVPAASSAFTFSISPAFAAFSRSGPPACEVAIRYYYEIKSSSTHHNSDGEITNPVPRVPIHRHLDLRISPVMACEIGSTPGGVPWGWMGGGQPPDPRPPTPYPLGGWGGAVVDAK